jgi:hypothetical protein
MEHVLFSNGTGWIEMAFEMIPQRIWMRKQKAAPEGNRTGNPESRNQQ